MFYAFLSFPTCSTDPANLVFNVIICEAGMFSYNILAPKSKGGRKDMDSPS
jgi:hypothetical protein